MLLQCQPGNTTQMLLNSLLADNQLTDRGRVDNCFVIECQHIASCCLVVDACDIVSVFVHTLWCVQRPPGRGETPEAARPGRPGHGVMHPEYISNDYQNHYQHVPVFESER